MRAHNFLDLTGKKFGRLTVIRLVRIDLSGKNKKTKPVWLCVCTCGKKIEIRTGNLTSSDTKSCGCLQREISSRNGKTVNKIHGMRNTRLYSIWRSMKKRCYDKKHIGYHNYGGRGINICDKWLNSFVSFRDDMYESYLQHCKKYGEKQTSIDRIDTNGNYELANCRWATVREQAAGRRGKPIGRGKRKPEILTS